MKFFLVGNQKGGMRMQIWIKKKLTQTLVAFQTSLGLCLTFGGVGKALNQHQLFLERNLVIAMTFALVAMVLCLVYRKTKLAIVLGLVSVELGVSAACFGLAHHDSGTAGVLWLIVLGANLSYGGVVWLVRYLIQSRGQ